MPRIRSIKPSFLHDEALDDLGDTVRIVYIGLWMYADREGRLEDRPRYLSMQILPYRAHLFAPALQALLDGGWVRRYAVNGKDYLHLPKFAVHQRPHHTEPASVLPAPISDDNGETTVSSPLPHVKLAQGNDQGNDQGKDLGSRRGSTTQARGALSVSGRVNGVPLGNRREHLQHACCGRVCLPAILFTEFVRLHGGDEPIARAYVSAFFKTHDPPPDAGPIGDDAFTFWRRTWAAHHASVAPDTRTIRQAQRRQAGNAAAARFVAAAEDDAL